MLHHSLDDVRTKENKIMIKVMFLIVDGPYSYNILIRWSGFNLVRAAL